MSEPDVFETRFATAYRRYLDEAPTEVDAAAVVRTVAAAHPRARTGARPWALGAARALAWLVLLALLLAALGAAALFVGSQRSALGFACPPGSTPDEPGPADQARPPDNSPTMAFDRRAGRLVALAGTVTGPVETWTFDVCTNTWTRMHPNQEPLPGGFGQLVYDVDSDVTIASDSTRMWAYDLEANTWTEKGPFAPFADPGFPSLRFYDPVSGLVVALGDDGDPDTLGLELWSYEVETDTWTPIRQANRLAVGPHYEFFAYDASVDRLVAHANAWQPAGDGGRRYEAKTWLFDLRTGTWSPPGTTSPPFGYGGYYFSLGEIAYDEAAQRTVLFSEGQVIAYDAAADRWETLYGTFNWPNACGVRPECRVQPSMVYDPINERLVVYGGNVHTAPEWWGPSDDVVAFDTRTREWTVLLEASEGQPAP